MQWKTTLISFVLGIVPTFAVAQSVNPVGTPFPISAGAFPNEAVAAGQPSGGFVVVWTAPGGDDRADLLGRRFDGIGTPVGTSFAVNDYTTGAQQRPRVCTDALGDFVVVWADGGDTYGQSNGRDGSGVGIFGRRFSSAGAAQGNSFLVNTTTTNHQHQPALACAPDGGFIVAWNSAPTVGGSGIMQAIQYDSLGNSLLGEFAIEIADGFPAIASNGAGKYAIVWEKNQDIKGAVIDESSPARAPPTTFVVNTYTTLLQRRAAVSEGADHGFVVAWEDAGQPGSPGTASPDGSGAGIFARRFDLEGTGLGAQFQVNAQTEGDQIAPAICTDTDKNFVVAWTSIGPSSTSRVVGRLFHPDGDSQGSFAPGADLATPLLESISCGSGIIRVILASPNLVGFSYVGQIFDYKPGAPEAGSTFPGALVSAGLLGSAGLIFVLRKRTRGTRNAPSNFT